jgi:hypothetical protein
MGKATGTWLVGVGLTAGAVALADDRASMGGNALAQLVFGAGSLFAIARFGGDADLGDPAAAALIAYLVASVASGAYAARVALAEGRFAPTAVRGGIPVELRVPSNGRERLTGA